MSSNDPSSLGAHPKGSMAGLIGDLVRPYRAWLTFILGAMLVETAMSLAGSWPLKIILDNAVGSHKPPEWLIWIVGPSFIAREAQEAP